MILYDNSSFFGVIFSCKGSVVSKVAGPCVLNTAIGFLATWLGKFVNPIFMMDSAGHVVAGTVVAFLLVFRSQISFARYWESREHLGGVVKASRSIVFKLCSHMPDNDAYAQKRRADIARLLKAHWILQMQQLRRYKDINILEQQKMVDAEERNALKSSKRPPLLTLYWIRQSLVGCYDDGMISERCLHNLCDEVTKLLEHYNGCTKILTTPIPFSYMQMLRLMLCVFIFTFPFSVTRKMSWATPLISAVVAFGYFGIDVLSTEIEEPFGDDPNDLPMETLGQLIASDLDDILEERGKLIKDFDHPEDAASDTDANPDVADAGFAVDGMPNMQRLQKINKKTTGRKRLDNLQAMMRERTGRTTVKKQATDMYEEGHVNLDMIGAEPQTKLVQAAKENSKAVGGEESAISQLSKEKADMKQQIDAYRREYKAKNNGNAPTKKEEKAALGDLPERYKTIQEQLKRAEAVNGHSEGLSKGGGGLM